MGLVSAADDKTAPTVLIVDNNPMSVMRLTNIFHTKDFQVHVCEDGDKAVDEYIRLDPELVVMALDLPSLDGHVAALEMREHGGDSRIIFVAPQRLESLANQASYSAGAVATFIKPISSSVVESQWEAILGPIPAAPGLEDLDELYPEDRIKPEADLGPIPLPLPALPPLPSLPTIPSPDLIPLPTLDVTVEHKVPSSSHKKEKQQRSRKKGFLVVFALFGAVAYWWFSTSGL